jgi:hypothetical protein
MWIVFDMTQDSPSSVEHHPQGFITAAGAKAWIEAQAKPWSWTTVFIEIPEEAAFCE